mmetsp:Transcript_27570/g.67048  ORF Transcript_27570/g.67048 Transcript_27570/m.67048 type:complete len:204 (-) Transcript_27570:221-832(-)
MTPPLKRPSPTQRPLILLQPRSAMPTSLLQLTTKDPPSVTRPTRTRILRTRRKRRKKRSRPLLLLTRRRRRIQLRRIQLSWRRARSFLLPRRTTLHQLPPPRTQLPRTATPRALMMLRRIQLLSWRRTKRSFLPPRRRTTLHQQLPPPPPRTKKLPRNPKRTLATPQKKALLLWPTMLLPQMLKTLLLPPPRRLCLCRPRKYD